MALAAALGANNHPDDVATSAESGAPLRADDPGDPAATASPLTPGASVTGITSMRTDIDAFVFTTMGGSFSFNATPAPANPSNAWWRFTAWRAFASRGT